MNDVEHVDRLEPIRPSSSGSWKALYIVCMVGGLVAAALIYGVFFDNFSETQLVNISALWFLPFMFGAYGLIAETLIRSMEKKQSPSWAAAVVEWALRFSALVGIVLLIPFFFVSSKRSWVVALVSVGFWGIVLVLFFALIFPML